MDNYNNEILKESGFGSNPNGAMFSPGSVMETSVPMDCKSNAPNLGMETSFGNDPNGEMFGAPAPDKMGIAGTSENWPSVSETLENRNIDSLTLEHMVEEGSCGPILPGRKY